MGCLTGARALDLSPRGKLITQHDAGKTGATWKLFPDISNGQHVSTEGLEDPRS